MGFLVLIAIALFLAGPVLAIMALAAVRRLERESPSLAQIPQLTSRIYVLEKRILALEAATHQAASAQGRPEDVKQTAVSPPETVTDQVRVKEPIFVRPEAGPTAPPPASVSVGSPIPRPPPAYPAAIVP